MRDFEYLTPNTLNEVLNILDSKRDEVRVVAGGTSIVPMLKQRLLAADTLVSLQNVKDLKGIRFATDGLHLGATTTHREVEISAQVKKEYPLIAESYSKVATVKIRNSATVAGQLVQADPSQDGAPCHIAMNSRINIISKGSKRTVPVEEFFADYYQAKLEPNELVSEVVVPKQPANLKTVYLKFLPRTEDDYATVSVAIAATVEGGVCKHIRIGLGAVGNTPVRAAAVEKQLLGQKVTKALIEKAAASVKDEISPLDDFHGSSAYKSDMAVVFVRRALEKVLEA